MHKKYEKAGNYDSSKCQWSHNRVSGWQWRRWNLNFWSQKNDDKNDYWGKEDMHKLNEIEEHK
jgi:hypothetical protein